MAPVIRRPLEAPPGGALPRVEQSGFPAPEEAFHYQGATYGCQQFSGGLEQVAAGLA